MNNSVKANMKFSSVGMLMLLGIFPLFVTDGYHNITITKAVFFAVTAFVFFILCVSVRLVCAEKLFDIKRMTRFDSPTLAFFCFAVCAVLSCLLSNYKKEAFTGSEGRYMGLLFIAALLAAYLFISENYVLNEKEFIAFSLASIVVCAVALVQYAGFDIFGFFKGISTEKRANFYSFIGNIDVFSSFLCMSATLSAYLACFGKGKKHIAYAISALLGFFCLFVSGSDGGFLGVAAAFAVMFLICSSTWEKLVKALWCYESFFACALLFGFVKPEKVSALTAILCNVKTASVAILIFGLLIFTVYRTKPNEKTLRICRIAFVISLAALIAAVAALMVYFTFIDTSSKLSGFLKYFRFNDKWGTERGYVWRRMFDLFGDASLLHKIFGSGEETVLPLMLEKYAAEMNSQGHYTDNAHNEYIQYLVTHGILGLLSYAGLIVISVREYIKRRGESVLYAGLILPVAAYGVQAFVNISQPITTPYFFIFLALISCRTKAPEKQYDTEKKGVKRKKQKVSV